MIFESLMLLALTAQPPAPPAPAPADAPAANGVTTDSEVWALARRANAVGAYESYLRRFPAGANKAEAIERWYRLKGLPPQPALPPAPPVSPPATAYSAYSDPCLMPGTPPGSASDQAEVAAFAAARRSNNLAKLRAHLSAFPEGICAAAAREAIRLRELKGIRFPAIPGFGPLPPQVLNRSILSDADYPAAALRAEESGDVLAAWEIAEDGVVEFCRVVRSSGSGSLDATTCRIISSRMRYDPARDVAGNPIRAANRMSVGWRIAGDPPAEKVE